MKAHARRWGSRRARPLGSTVGTGWQAGCWNSTKKQPPDVQRMAAGRRERAISNRRYPARTAASGMPSLVPRSAPAWLTDPAVSALSRMHVSPNMLTLAGVAGNIVAGVLAAAGAVLAAWHPGPVP